MGDLVEEALAEQGTSSEAKPPVQDQGKRGVSEETNTLTDSEAERAQVQEQPTTGQKPAIDEAEIRRRIEQSERDRIRHQAMLEAQQKLEAQRAYEAEQKRLAEMDDEEFGQYMRQMQQEQARLTQIQQQVAMQQWATYHNQFLSTIKDPDLRNELEQRGQRGEFQSYTEFLEAAQRAQLEKELEAKLAAERKRLEKEIRDAVQKERTAEETENDSGPVIGSGTPTSYAERMTSDQLIATGWQEEIERSRRGR